MNDRTSFLFFLLLCISLLILSCGDGGGGGSGSGGVGSSGSGSSSVSLLTGAYSIDLNGSDGGGGGTGGGGSGSGGTGGGGTGGGGTGDGDDPSSSDGSGSGTEGGLAWNRDDGDSDSGSTGDGEATDEGGPTNPQLPMMNYSACISTMDGLISLSSSNILSSTLIADIQQGKKLENLFINIKLDNISPSYALHWDELGWKEADGAYGIPAVLYAKVKYTKDIVGSAPQERSVHIFTPPNVSTMSNKPPLYSHGSHVYMRFIISSTGRYAYTTIHIDKLYESGAVSEFEQQLWNNQADKDAGKPSMAGDDPEITRLGLFIPLRKDAWGNWYLQHLSFQQEKIKVNRIVWGPWYSDYTPEEGCFDRLPGAWDNDDNFNPEQNPWWSRTHYAMPEQ